MEVQFENYDDNDSNSIRDILPPCFNTDILGSKFSIASLNIERSVVELIKIANTFQPQIMHYQSGIDFCQR